MENKIINNRYRYGIIVIIAIMITLFGLTYCFSQTNTETRAQAITQWSKQRVPSISGITTYNNSLLFIPTSVVSSFAAGDTFIFLRNAVERKIAATIFNLTLAQVLSNGNSTGSNNINVSTGQTLFSKSGNIKSSLSFSSAGSIYKTIDTTTSKGCFLEYDASVTNPTVALYTQNSAGSSNGSILIETEAMSLTAQSTTGYTQLYLSSDGGTELQATKAGYGGLKYATDYSSNFTSRSMVDKGYTDATYNKTLTAGQNISISTNTISVTGVLPIINGGTNATTANAGFNNLAPSQSSNSGKFLKTDATNTSWAYPPNIYLIGAASINPADATTYYVGTYFAGAPLSVAASNRVYFTRAGTITAANFFFGMSAGGTTENISIYIRLNNTTDYTLSTTLQWDASKGVYYSGLSIPISSTSDYIELKIVSPTWGTNPANVRINGWLNFE